MLKVFLATLSYLLDTWGHAKSSRGVQHNGKTRARQEDSETKGDCRVEKPGVNGKVEKLGEIEGQTV